MKIKFFDVYVPSSALLRLFVKSATVYTKAYAKGMDTEPSVAFYVIMRNGGIYNGICKVDKFNKLYRYLGYRRRLDMEAITLEAKQQQQQQWRWLRRLNILVLSWLHRLL